MDLLPEECQYLPPTHMAETDESVIGALVETLYLLAARGGVEAREVMKEKGVYIVVRELHLRLASPENKPLQKNGEDSSHERVGQDDNVGSMVPTWCERIVDLLMGDDKATIPPHDDGARMAEGRVQEVEEDQKDTSITPIF